MSTATDLTRLRELYAAHLADVPRALSGSEAVWFHERRSEINALAFRLLPTLLACTVPPPVFKRGDRVRVIRAANGSWLKTQLDLGAEFVVTKGNYLGDDGHDGTTQLVNVKCPGGVGWSANRFELVEP